MASTRLSAMPAVCLEPLEQQAWLEKAFEPWLNQNGMEGVGALPRCRPPAATVADDDILDQNSVLILAAVASATACFPFQTGIRGLIQKAEILIGGRSIASSEDYAHIATLRRLAHVSPEDRVQKDMVLTGALGDRFGVAVGNKLAFRDLVYSDNATAEVPAGFSATADDNTTPLFSLKISELIPMMRSRQLPLGMIKQPVFLKIRFNVQTAAGEDQGKIVVKSYADANLSASVSLPNVVFLADTLFYSPSV